MSVAIRVEQVSKAYQLGQIGTGTLARDIERWWATSVRGKEDPFLKIGEVNDRSRKGDSDVVWALRDVTFDVQEGEVLGIIGRNGAGKSTLLKILSRTTAPTRGTVKIKGRMASLLEVGTGFHPELTGRENIFLNGAILGMRKAEISRKFDEIVDFSGVERYIDTPVKRYSSGMYVRLAFAVAAHLEPEILVVDEVLAVGDAEFQKKCLGKMKDVSDREGRTVLFVSHNMAAVESLCSRAILVSNGLIALDSSVDNVLRKYLTRLDSMTVPLLNRNDRSGNGAIIFDRVSFGQESSNSNVAVTGQEFEIRLHYKKTVFQPAQKVLVALGIDDQYGNRITHVNNEMVHALFESIDVPIGIFSIKIKRLPLTAGRYSVTVFCSINGEVSDWVEQAFDVEVENGDFYGTGKLIHESQGHFLIDYDFNLLDSDDK